MNTLEILFFVLLFIVFYTYVGYGILLWILVKIKQSFISFYDTDSLKRNQRFLGTHHQRRYLHGRETGFQPYYL